MTRSLLIAVPSRVQALVDAAELPRRLLEAGMHGARVRAWREGAEVREAGPVRLVVELAQACLLGAVLAPPVSLLVVLDLRAQAVDLRLHALEVLAELGGREAQVDRVLPDLLDPHLQGAEGVLEEGEGGAGHGANVRKLAEGARKFFLKGGLKMERKKNGMNLFIHKRRVTSVSGHYESKQISWSLDDTFRFPDCTCACMHERWSSPSNGCACK